MTNTLTTDHVATIKQIKMLEEAGADIIRVSCPDEESTKALKKITKKQIPLLLQIFIFTTKEQSNPLFLEQNV